MNFYCCVHSQSALNLHKELALKLNRYIDKDISYKYICGTKARNKFNDSIINAYDNNISSKYNKKFRYFTSLYYLLNNIELDKFYFSNISFFLQQIDQVKVNTYDLILRISQVANENGKFSSNISYGLDVISKQDSNYKESTLKFYKDNFDVDLFDTKNKWFQLGCSFINAKNPYIKEWFNRTLQPFMCDEGYKYFQQELILIAFAKTYMEFKDKINITSGILTKWYSHQEIKEYITNNNNYNLKDMHYYGE